LKEFKVNVGLDQNGMVVFMNPVKPADGEVVRYTKMTARLYTEQDLRRELSECMQQDCHTYERVDRGRIRQKR
jgi:hypothetical protein